MSLARWLPIFSHPAAAVAAFLLLLGATAWLESHNPKYHIKARFEERFSPEDNPFFLTDSSFVFKPDRLYKMLSAYRDDGAGKNDWADHLKFICYDFFYPFAYAISWAVLILWLQGALSPDVSERVRWLFLIPFAACAFDLLENFSMRYILTHKVTGAGQHDAVVYLTITATVLKWVFVYISLGLILTGVIGLLLKSAYRFKP